MKKINNLGMILLIASIISPIIAFNISSVVGEVVIFEVAGAVRYSWIMWLFIPIPIGSLIVGIVLYNNKQAYLKNIIVAVICIPILFCFGSFKLIFKNFSYDTNKIAIIEKQVNIELPDSLKVATINQDSYSVSYVKITNKNSAKEFEEEIGQNNLWEDTLSSKIKGLMPIEIQYKFNMFDKFLFYNMTSLQYNKFPSDGRYKCVFIAYDYEMNRFIIIDNYIVDVS